jgi:hypothetical protein
MNPPFAFFIWNLIISHKQFDTLGFSADECPSSPQCARDVVHSTFLSSDLTIIAIQVNLKMSVSGEILATGG